VIEKGRAGSLLRYWRLPSFTEGALMQLHTIGIDLGKTVFHLVGLNTRGEVVVRKRVLPHSCCSSSEPPSRSHRHGSLRRSQFLGR
jgi:hypothetical protein